MKLKQDFILDPSLVLYLPLYELDAGAANGNKFMSSDRYGHLATITGALWRPDGRDFDGDDDIIALPLAFGSLTNLTLELWIKIASGGDTNKLFAGFFKDANNRFNPLIGGTTAITSELIVGGVNTSISANAAPVTNRWYHSAFLLGTGGMLMYLYGIKQTATNATTNSFANISPMVEVQLGKYTVADTANVWKGLIGEVRLYSRRLTAGEIQHNYLATKWRYR